jgi:hypothetical protein
LLIFADFGVLCNTKSYRIVERNVRYAVGNIAAMGDISLPYVQDILKNILNYRKISANKGASFVECRSRAAKSQTLVQNIF